MEYRVDELAGRAGVSVDTVRFYQSRGLLAPPTRRGRAAYYSADHVARLERIRDLKAKGFTLASIRSLLAGDLDLADQALIAALVRGPAASGGELLGPSELAERTGVSTALIEALEREGLLAHLNVDGERRYTRDDADMLSAGLALLGTGLPLGELLALARRHDGAMRALADEAVDLFVRFVRDPIRAEAESDDEAASKLVGAFDKMFSATGDLVARHFKRVLLEAALSRIERDGSRSEIEAVRNVRAEAGSAWPG